MIKTHAFKEFKNTFLWRHYDNEKLFKKLLKHFIESFID